MIKSMTGFGRYEMTDENRKITVEIKAVNHRYLDINMKIPKKLNYFDTAIRGLLKEYVQRGKVDVFLSYEDYTEGKKSLRYNEELANEYYHYLQKMADQFHMENDTRVSTLARFPEVLSMEEQTDDEEQLWELLEGVIREAGRQFNESKAKEGEHLKEDLLEKLSEMDQQVCFIESRFPDIIAEYRQRLTDKVKDLLGDNTIDEGRLITEVTLYADKICVDEETVRLRSHIKATRDALLAGGNVGRKLDFIAQEMNREANTILSKNTDLALSNVGIDLKTGIEKVREQIQNIE